LISDCIIMCQTYRYCGGRSNSCIHCICYPGWNYKIYFICWEYLCLERLKGVWSLSDLSIVFYFLLVISNSNPIPLSQEITVNIIVILGGQNFWKALLV